MSLSLTTLAYQCCRDLGCLRPGTKAVQSADVLADIQDAANQLLNSWTGEQLMVFATPASIFPLQFGLEQYKIGPGQVSPNFNAPRPAGIAEANVVIQFTSTPTVRRSLVQWTQQEWAQITVRAYPAGSPAPIAAIPEGIYYDNDYDEASGYATINLWPAPQSTPQALELFTTETMPFASFADLTTVYNFPPMYERALRKNLADEIAPMMTMYWKAHRLEGMQSVSEAMWAKVHEQAVETKAMIMSSNWDDGVKFVDPAFRGSGNRAAFNYGTGTNGGRV